MNPNDEPQQQNVIIGGQEIKVEQTTPIIETSDVSETLTPEQIAAKKAEQESTDNPSIVQIEDEQGQSIEYTLDEKGNAIKDGQIVYTKEQLESFIDETQKDSDDNDEDVITAVSTLTGIELVDDKGQPLTFKEGIEGLAERETTVKEVFYNKGKEEALTEFLEENPDMANMYAFKRKHGSLEGYEQSADYSKIIITDETPIEEVKSIYRQYLLSKGNDSETTEKLIKLSESEETIRKDAFIALGKLKEEQINAYEEDKKQQLLAEQKSIKQVQNYYGIDVDDNGKVKDLNIEGSIYDKIVKKGTIGNITIPNEGLIFTKDGKKELMTRNQIFGYFYNPVKKVGNSLYTQAQLDESNRLKNTDNFIIQGIRNLAGNDLTTLEKAFAIKNNVDNSKKLLKIVKGSKGTPTISQSEIEEQIKKGTAKVIYK